ncbi:hypothetical protein [Arsenophonus sp.]|uniref:hypothetical protein n=1 Tax=Arsenophonus sp. TaxID=1872640 RepID=UPI0028549429|nr:hypothetical protein [Arsenophonus sp.]MDR5618296.1 hypothetical protein [Arsenophonus sp.]
MVDLVGGGKNALELLAIFIAGAWVSKGLGAFGKIARLPFPALAKIMGSLCGLSNLR